MRDHYPGYDVLSKRSTPSWNRQTREVAYYMQPTAWSEIGWGGPASPRGYVRHGLRPPRSLGGGRGQARP